MTWQLTTTELVDGVARRREMVQEHRSRSTLELLARGLRWVDEVPESRRLFHEAAIYVIERVEQPGRGSGRSRARTAGFFALADELEQAREWGLRAVDTLLLDHDLGLREVTKAVETLYACGEPDRALALAREHDLQSVAVVLIEADLGGDAVRCEAAVRKLVRYIVAERFGPFDANGDYPLHVWDWRTQPRLSGATWRRLFETARL